MVVSAHGRLRSWPSPLETPRPSLHDASAPPHCSSLQASRRQLGLATAIATASWLYHRPPPAAAAPLAPPLPFCGVTPTMPAWAFGTPWQEDNIPHRGYKIWYR